MKQVQTALGHYQTSAVLAFKVRFTSNSGYLLSRPP